MEERTFQFALRVRQCLAGGSWERWQWTDVRQLLRSSGSVAANYVEANHAITKPEFIHRIGVAKKEAGESRLWLRLLGATTTEPAPLESLRTLYRESDELVRIFATILRNPTSSS